MSSRRTFHEKVQADGSGGPGAVKAHGRARKASPYQRHKIAAAGWLCCGAGRKISGLVRMLRWGDICWKLANTGVDSPRERAGACL
jgi:hypothetical protein